jgi:hypothetical protein
VRARKGLDKAVPPEDSIQPKALRILESRSIRCTIGSALRAREPDAAFTEPVLKDGHLVAEG